MFSQHWPINLTDCRWTMRNGVPHMPRVTPSPLSTSTTVRQYNCRAGQGLYCRAILLQGPTVRAYFPKLVRQNSPEKRAQSKAYKLMLYEGMRPWRGSKTPIIHNQAAQGFWRNSAPHLALRVCPDDSTETIGLGITHGGWGRRGNLSAGFSNLLLSLSKSGPCCELAVTWERSFLPESGLRETRCERTDLVATQTFQFWDSSSDQLRILAITLSRD